jgi:sodium transport system permease protein
MLVPVCATTSALFLAVAAFARDFKDGQNYLTPALLVLLLPLYTAAMPFVELNAWTAFIPFVNIALLIKALFLAEAKPDAIFLTLVSSAAYAMLAIQFAGAVFQRETVLLGGGSFKSLLKVERGRRATPTPGLALLAFALMLVAGFYGSLALRKAGLTTMMLAVQLGFILAPAIALTALHGFSWRETFALRAPSIRAVAGSLLAGASAWAVASVSIRLLPPPESFVEAMKKVLLLDDPSVPLWLVWTVIALAPAICEELFFRGFVLGGLREWGVPKALGVSAVLFGLAHASIYRFLPTVLLGLLIGYTVWKTGSIFCGMIIHAANNGIAVAIAKIEPISRTLDADRVTFLPWPYTLAGAAALAVALLLIARAEPPRPPISANSYGVTPEGAPGATSAVTPSQASRPPR